MTTTTVSPASHLTYAQAARFLGITWAAVQERVKRGSLTMIEEEGVKMIPKSELVSEKGADAGRRESAQKWSRKNERAKTAKARKTAKRVRVKKTK